MCPFEISNCCQAVQKKGVQQPDLANSKLAFIEMYSGMCRPSGTLDLGDVEAVEGALADARDVADIVVSGANFGQAEQVPSSCAAQEWI